MERLWQRGANRGSCFIESIPNEVLNEIFSVDSLRLPFPQWPIRTHPVLRVNQRWRALALACHSLWTLIRFVGCELDQMLQHRGIPFHSDELEEHLKWSGNSPLDIRIEDLRYIRSCSPDKQWDVLLVPLLNTVHRWRSCHLDAALHPITPKVIDLFRVSLVIDHLTTLYINGRDLGNNSAYAITLTHLQELTVAGDSSSRCLRLKCPSLKFFTLERAFLTGTRLQTLTEDMPMLHTLALKHCIGPMAEQSGLISIFPSLRSLVLVLSSMQEYYDAYDTRTSFLNMLNLIRAIPHLVTLDCALEDFHPSYVYRAILGIASPILQHLRLHITRSTTIQSQEDLKHLRVENFSNREFGYLLVNHLRRCADLETLVIEGDRLIGPFSPPYPLHPVLDFLSSPQGMAACPKLIKIAFANLMVEDDQKIAFIRNRWLCRLDNWENSSASPLFALFVDHQEVKVTSSILIENSFKRNSPELTQTS